MVRGRHELAGALFAHMPPALFEAYVEALDAVLARFRELSGGASASDRQSGSSGTDRP